MYVFTLHLDDYLMLWFSLRAFILVFSKFKYSLENIYHYVKQHMG